MVKFIYYIIHYLGAPLPVPYTSSAVKVAQCRLKQMKLASKVHVGLENLAFAFNITDVINQGKFIKEILEEVDGVLLLDLHNLYCQIENFNLNTNEILNTYPLQRVRAIHISGGSWSYSCLDNKKKI